MNMISLTRKEKEISSYPTK